jgi:hypothetical protein
VGWQRRQQRWCSWEIATEALQAPHTLLLLLLLLLLLYCVVHSR